MKDQHAVDWFRGVRDVGGIDADYENQAALVFCTKHRRWEWLKCDIESVCANNGRTPDDCILASGRRLAPDNKPGAGGFRRKHKEN